ncbi:MAG: hypothetical protein K8I27_09980 [Planctomycetes bacterium]|nr:hypothetical protein [Planctomycetota bacterium]
MRIFTAVVCGATLAAMVGCSGTPEPESAFSASPVADTESNSPETPMDQRISDALQEAKQQYDDGHYDTAFRYAQQAEGLIVEYDFPIEDEAMALTIQGYCLLQRGSIDDYFVKTHGMQEGAVSKFRRAISLRDGDFRSELGIALAQFRRHGDSIRKAESLGDGILTLEAIREDFRRGMNSKLAGKRDELLREAQRKLTVFKTNRTSLIGLGYIFQDPVSIKRNDDGSGPEPEWLGILTQNESELLVNDMNWILDDAIAGAEITAEDTAKFRAAALDIADSWRKVRKYWRVAGLDDLQQSRDRLLQVRKRDETLAEEMGRMSYFWVDRDLAFVFQSLGAFFLDSAMERARLMAIAEGVPELRLEARAKEVFLDTAFDTWEKTESRRNYEAALTYTKSFVNRHRQFEKLRLQRVSEAEESEINSNPFLVDLISRYRATMDELVQEERAMRARMVLEAAALCIDPLFQINDLRLAIVWANELKAMSPSDPIHLFVAATAYFQAEDWEAAMDNYDGYLQASSIANDSRRRTVARQRILECEQYLAREAGAGEDSGR